jgi:hypothetical protein
MYLWKFAYAVFNERFHLGLAIADFLQNLTALLTERGSGAQLFDGGPGKV